MESFKQARIRVLKELALRSWRINPKSQSASKMGIYLKFDPKRTWMAPSMGETGEHSQSFILRYRKKSRSLWMDIRDCSIRRVMRSINLHVRDIEAHLKMESQ